MDKMRGGGPRMICSPYFTIGSVLVLLIITAKYYSLSTEHDSLLMKVKVLQDQMKLTASNMRSLDSSLTQKEESFHECDKEKQKVLQRNDELQKTIDAKTEELLTLATKNDESDAVIHQLQTEIESLKTVEDQVSAQKGEIEALKMREEECRNIEAQVAQLQGELNTMKMSAQEFHSNLQLENNHQNQLPEGELQDVNPAAVSIRQPALNGIRGHGVPILPHSDPRAIKAKPKLHLDAELHDDEAVRSQIIAEEEAKEDQIQVVQDPKPNDPGFFYAKQEKYKQNKAIDPEIDLTQLNRNENLDGETAVLKQPLDLNAIQQLPIIEEGVIKEEDADFPDDKEKRDPSVILQDPLARDQDNDVRIYEAIQNGFDKKTGQSPPSE